MNILDNLYRPLENNIRLNPSEEIMHIEEVIRILRAEYRHGDYDNEFRDGWNAAIEQLIKRIKGEM